MKMQGGKKLREGGNKLDPARKLVIAMVSPLCGTHATEDMKVGALIRGSRECRERTGKGDGERGRGRWKNVVKIVFSFCLVEMGGRRLGGTQGGLCGHKGLTPLKCRGFRNMSWPQAAEYNLITNKQMPGR